MTQPILSLTGPQGHQEQSSRLCPLWLQRQSRLPFSVSWRSFTMSRPLQPGVRLLRRLCHPSHTLAFSRPHTRQGGVGLPKFHGVQRIEIPVASCCRPGAGGITYRDKAEPRYQAPSLFGSGVPATFTCWRSRSLDAGSSRQQRKQVWSVNLCVASSCRTFVPGLPTLTSAARERRPGRPSTVMHV